MLFRGWGEKGRPAAHFCRKKAQKNKKEALVQQLAGCFDVHRNFIIIIIIDDSKANGMSCMCSCG